MRHFARVFLPAIILMLLLSIALILPQDDVAAQSFGSGWVAQYYDNPDLAGSPVVGRIDPQINFNFAEGSPSPNFVPEDNFSARWNSLEQFDAAGRYRFTVQADDGARVIIDGNTVIDQFGNTGTFVATADVDLTRGAHDITVEYVERSGTALIQFFWDPFEVLPTDTPGPSPTPTATALPEIPPGALTATVIDAAVLNIRSAPSLGGDRISRVFRGQTYQVIGRNAGADWFLLQLSGFQGWAYGYYLFFNFNEFTAPISAATTDFPVPEGYVDTGVLAQTEATMRLRGEPNVMSPQTGRITWGSFLPVIARTADNQWILVEWKGTLGWVFTPFLEIIQGDLNSVPVR